MHKPDEERELTEEELDQVSGGNGGDAAGDAAGNGGDAGGDAGGTVGDSGTGAGADGSDCPPNCGGGFP